MTLKNVKPSLNKITKSLAVTQDSREFLLKNTTMQKTKEILLQFIKGN